MPSFAIHPILLALYFPLFLYSRNVTEVDGRVAFYPTLVVLLAMFAGWAGLWLILRNWRRSAIVLSLNILVFFSYGQLSEWLRAAAGGIGHYHKVAALLWIAATVALILIVRRLSRLKETTAILNVMSIVVLAFPLISIGHYQTARSVKSMSGESDKRHKPAQSLLNHATDKGLPDIYYIVLDAHTRSDVLRESFGYDDSSFVNYLRAEGFSVFDDSYSNYVNTSLCLASTLNGQYLQDMIGQSEQDGKYVDLRGMVLDSWALEVLRNAGYAVVVLANGIEPPSARKAADQFLGPSWAMGGRFLDEYQNGLIKMTPLPAVARLLYSEYPDPFEQHRSRIEYALDYLRTPNFEKRPRFVLAHILAPHVPIVFGATGEALEYGEAYLEIPDADPRRFVSAYADELRYLHPLITGVIADILRNSHKNAIIILQGDHGEYARRPVPPSLPDTCQLWQRHAILNAMYIPGSRAGESLSGLSPVNTFRLLFSSYFGLDTPLLEDRMYFSTLEDLFGLTDVTEALVQSEGACR